MDKGIALTNLLGPNNEILLSADRIRLLTATGATTVRLEFRLGASAAWDEELLDLYKIILTNLQHAGVTTIIGELTHQLVQNPNRNEWNAPLVNGTNQFINQYLNAVHTVVAAFKDFVVVWEIWNEPNNTANDSFTFIQPAVYAALLRQAYHAIKALQQGSVVISGGIFGFDEIPGNQVNFSRNNSGSDYLDSVFASLQQQGGLTPLPLDGIGQHLYLDQGNPLQPAHLQSYINTYYAVIDAYIGRHVPNPLPIYITEAGWATPQGEDQDTVQAAKLTTLVEVCKNNALVLQDNTRTGVAPYVAAVCWFTLYDGQVPKNLGLFTADGVAKPSLEAFVNA
jgi:hypothetical protein